MRWARRSGGFVQHRSVLAQNALSGRRAEEDAGELQQAAAKLDVAGAHQHFALWRAANLRGTTVYVKVTADGGRLLPESYFACPTRAYREA